MFHHLRPAFFAAVVAVSCIAAAAQQSRWLDVPFVSQPKEGCGAAVISMTLQYWKDHGAGVAGTDFDVDAIQRQLHSHQDRGIRASDMVRYFTRLGFRAIAFRGDRQDIANHIAKGRPLIVALRESTKTLHYVVVVGTDPSGKIFLVNDPAQRKLLKMDGSEFEKAWAGAENWTLLAVPNH